MAIPTPLINRSRQVAVAVESTKGTAATITYATDGLILAQASRVFPEFETFTREFDRSSLSRLAHIITNKPVRIELTVEVRRSNSTDTPDVWGRLLQGCGFTETTNASTSVVYNPESDFATMKTLTMVVNIDGYEVKVKGCMGNVTFRGEIGSPMLASFTFRGSFVSAGDVAQSAITHETGMPPAFQGIDFQWNSNDVCIRTLEINMNNDLVSRDCANDATGVLHYFIGGRDPEATLDPEMNLAADSDGEEWWDELENANEREIDFDLGANITFNAPKAQIKTISDDERSGLAVAGIAAGLNEDSAGDDELTITFT